MKRLNKLLLLLSLIGIFQLANAQDTLKLSHGEFLAVVKSYHPLAFRYRLQNQVARAQVQGARGGFDPILSAKKGAKNIDGTEYYRESNVELGIPTWYGVELNGNYAYLDGQRLDNSETRGSLYQFGLTVPLAKNLLYDKRRALLDQARFALQMTEAEQTLLTNDLMLEADNAYWEWVKAHEILLLQERAVKVNRERLALTKKTFRYGEKAAIDTVEALTQLQGFELEQKAAYLDFIKATQQLTLFMWRDEQQPFDASRLIVPSTPIEGGMAFKDYLSLIAAVDGTPVSNHASLLFYLRKQDILYSERRLKFQGFLPKADLTYNFLNKENYRSNLFPLFQDNYRFGLKLEIPILLRQGRADFRMARLKVQQNQLDIDYKRQEISTKINTYKNMIISYDQQIGIAIKNAKNFQRLFQAEQMKYDNGESSLFLVNSRENKFIEMQEKLLELRLKFLQGYNHLKWTKENFMR